jgi:chromosomal replication initiator protein
MYQAHYLTEQGINLYKTTISEKHYLEHKRSQSTPENCEKIIRLVFDYFKIPLEMVKSKSRKRNLIVTRQFAMYFLKKEFSDLTLQQIAKYFDKDHSTVVHSIKQIKGLIEFNLESRENEAKILERIIELYK